MSKFTKEQQAIMLHDAARASHMDGHVTTSRPYTMAEKAMAHFGGKPGTPRKKSFLYLDAVDACFFYDDNGKAVVTCTARWSAGAADLDKMANAAELIKTMLQNMTEQAEKALAGEGNTQPDEEPEWKKRMMQTFLGGR